jgi:hypothetical protein
MAGPWAKYDAALVIKLTPEMELQSWENRNTFVEQFARVAAPSDLNAWAMVISEGDNFTYIYAGSYQRSI